MNSYYLMYNITQEQNPRLILKAKLYDRYSDASVGLFNTSPISPFTIIEQEIQIITPQIQSLINQNINNNKADIVVKINDFVHKNYDITHIDNSYFEKKDCFFNFYITCPDHFSILPFISWNYYCHGIAVGVLDHYCIAVGCLTIIV